jgi:hypothetical protein
MLDKEECIFIEQKKRYKFEDWKRSYTRMLFVTDSIQLIQPRKLLKGLETSEKEDK